MGFDGYSDDIYHAEKLQTAFEEFIGLFEDAGASGICRDLIENESKQFKGGVVGQQPEHVTQKHLVVPVLEALGYEVTERPVEILKDEQKQPDLELRNLGPECVGIVECKALNRERNQGKAEDSLEDRYLCENAFARYKKELEMQYLVGIATDGFDWKIEVKDVETDELVPEFEAEYSLVDQTDGIQHAYYKRFESETRTDWPGIRETLAQEFVSNFAIHNLPGQ